MATTVLDPNSISWKYYARTHVSGLVGFPLDGAKCDPEHL
jgi:hypothetical protein